MDSLGRREKRFVGFGLGTYSKKIASVEKSYNHNTNNFFKFEDIFLCSGNSIRLSLKLLEKLGITASQADFSYLLNFFAFVMTQTKFCAQQLLPAPDTHNMFASSELSPSCCLFFRR